LETLNTEAWERVARQPCVVQWTVSRDTHAAVSLSGWVVQQATDCRNFQVGHYNLFTSSLRMGTRTCIALNDRDAMRSRCGWCC
jgi:hypothetical protein